MESQTVISSFFSFKVLFSGYCLKLKTQKKIRKMLHFSRRRQYERLGLVIEKKLNKNNEITQEERINIERQIIKSIKELDRDKILNLYCFLFPEHATLILNYVNTPSIPS